MYCSRLHIVWYCFYFSRNLLESICYVYLIKLAIYISGIEILLSVHAPPNRMDELSPLKTYWLTKLLWIVQLWLYEFDKFILNGMAGACCIFNWWAHYRVIEFRFLHYVWDHVALQDTPDDSSYAVRPEGIREFLFTFSFHQHFSKSLTHYPNALWC